MSRGDAVQAAVLALLRRRRGTDERRTLDFPAARAALEPLGYDVEAIAGALCDLVWAGALERVTLGRRRVYRRTLVQLASTGPLEAYRDAQRAFLLARGWKRAAARRPDMAASRAPRTLAGLARRAAREVAGEERWSHTERGRWPLPIDQAAAIEASIAEPVG